MLSHIKGNLIDLAEQGEFDIIVHGANCQNVFGSGIAKEIRERYPQAYEADTIYSKTVQPIMKLGNWSSAHAMCRHPTDAWGTFTIINAYTQVNFMPRDVDHFEYESFSLILRKLLELAPAKFGFPYIGMGLAGGDANRIIPMIEAFAVQVAEKGGSVSLVEFQP